MPDGIKLTNQERYKRYDKPDDDKCRVDHRRVRQTNHGTVVSHPGEIAWQTGPSAGADCGCGYEGLVLGEIDMPTECPGCGCHLYVEIDVKIMRVLQCQTKTA